MKIKKELSSYRNIVSMILEKEQEKEEIADSKADVSGPSYDVTGSRPTGYIQTNKENKIYECDRKIDLLNREIKKLKRTLNVLDSLILTLDAEEKLIIVGFFLEGKTNRKICKELDAFRGITQENEQSTIEAIKKRKGRIIKKMQKRYDNRTKN